MAASLYDILGVAHTATTDEIRKAYKQKALETHPDKLDVNASQEEKESSQLAFHQVVEAFEILSNSDKRRAYNIRRGYRTVSSGTGLPLSEEHIKRQKDREEWNRRETEKWELHRTQHQEEARVAANEILRQEEETREYVDMVSKMLNILCDRNPEWERRRKAAKKRCPSARTAPL